MAVAITPAIQVLSTPDTVPTTGMTGWWRPEELREDYGDKASGTPVLAWRDASGNGRNLAQATSANAPLWTPYFSDSSWWFPGVRFVGASPTWFNTGLVMSTFLGTNGVGTIYVVGRVDAAVSAMVIGAYSATSTTNSTGLVLGSTVRAQSYDGTADYAALAYDARVVEGDDTGTGFTVFSWIKESGPDAVYAACIKATSGLDSAGLASGTAGAPTDLTAEMVLGVQYGGSAFTGAVSEVIVYNVVHNEATRQQVARYLRKKYGIREDEDKTGMTWTDITGDVLASNEVSCSYGLPGAGLGDRVADTGQMSFTLNNSEKNVAGLRGYYTPGHVNAWSAWKLGTEVRLALTYGGTTYYKWRGYVNALEIPPGMHVRQAVSVRCVDWMDVAARGALRGADSAAQLQTSKRSDQVLRHLVGRFETPPPSVSLGYGSDTYPYALDNSESETVSLMSEFQRLANSELGFVYMKGDTTRGGVLTFESRMKRGQKTGSVFTLDHTKVLNLSSSYSVDDIVNEVQVQIFPRRVDTSNAILFTLQDRPDIARNTSRAFFCPFRDPADKATRVGGTSMVTPVATTDYTFNAAADGTGADLTAQLAVSVSWGANGAAVYLLNNGPLDGYLTKLQLRGLGIYGDESIVFTAGDSESQSLYGKRVERFDMPYQSSPSVGLDAAYFALNQGKAARQRLRGVVFLANHSDGEAIAALAREISDRVTVQDTTSGGYLTPDAIDGDFFIQAVNLQITQGGLVRCVWTLAPADADAYWILQTSGFTELGDTTRLSYGLFSPQWQLDVSTVGVDTIVNA